MARLFNPSKDKPLNSKDNKNISFTGLYKNSVNGLRKLYQTGIDALSKRFGGIIDSKIIQRLANKFHDTKFEQYIITMTDILATGAFVGQTASSNKINDDEKKLLIYNSIISTGLSLAGMYFIDRLTEKPTHNFVENFKKANANSPKLDKYLEGIRIVKPLMILGVLYYIVIPLVSVFCADKFVHQSKGK